MKKYIINLIFLILPLYSFIQAQTVQEQFAGFGNIFSVTSLGSSNYTIVLTGFTGSPRFEVNGTWVGSDVNVGDVLFRDGARYVVTLVNSSNSGGFNVRVNSPDEGLGVSALNNGDIVAVGREFMGLFPMPRQGDNAGTGIPPSLASSIEIHNMKIMGNLGVDYVTTDSFNTFIGGFTFASIPINKTVWRTTTGSKYQKTSATVMTARSTDNGLLATTIPITNNDTILFNSRLNNRVRMNTGNVTTARIQDPLYYFLQPVGETFVIDVQAGTSDVTLSWGSAYGVYTGTSFSAMPTTVVPAQSIMSFTFRVITTSAEIVRFQYVDGLSGGSSGASNALQLPLGYTETIGTTSVDSTGEAIQAIAELLDVRATATGVVVDWQKKKVFGTSASPVTGNVTFNFANAAIDEQYMIHRSFTPPTFPGTAIIEGTYVSGANNLINFRYFSTSIVGVSINRF